MKKIVLMIAGVISFGSLHADLADVGYKAGHEIGTAISKKLEDRKKKKIGAAQPAIQPVPQPTPAPQPTQQCAQTVDELGAALINTINQADPNLRESFAYFANTYKSKTQMDLWLWNGPGHVNPGCYTEDFRNRLWQYYGGANGPVAKAVQARLANPSGPVVPVVVPEQQKKYFTNLTTLQMQVTVVDKQGNVYQVAVAPQNTGSISFTAANPDLDHINITLGTDTFVITNADDFTKHTFNINGLRNYNAY